MRACIATIATLILAASLTGCASDLPVTGLDPITTENPIAARLNGVKPLVLASDPENYSQRAREYAVMQAAVLAKTATILPDAHGLPRFVWLVDENGKPLEVTE